MSQHSGQTKTHQSLKLKQNQLQFFLKYNKGVSQERDMNKSAIIQTSNDSQSIDGLYQQNRTPVFNQQRNSFQTTIIQKQEALKNMITQTNIHNGKYGDMSWIFLKNNNMNQKLSKKDLNSSYQVIIQSPLDTKNQNLNNSVVEERNYINQTMVDFNDIIQKKIDIKADQVTLNQQEETPLEVLNKITKQVHDQICPNGQRKNDHSQESKNTNLSMSEIIDTQQNNQDNQQKTSFQSFKKQAMRLPKVSMRATLMNNFYQNMSQPISPRNNNNSEDKKQQQLGLPIIERTTQQSTYLIENSSVDSQKRKNQAKKRLNNSDNSQNLNDLQLNQTDEIIQNKVNKIFKLNSIIKTNKDKQKTSKVNSLNSSQREQQNNNQNIANSSQSSNTKLCSDCQKQLQKSQRQKKYSWDLQGGVEIQKYQQQNKSCFSEEQSPRIQYKINISQNSQEKQYNTIRENEYFNKFSINYNYKLNKVFEEVDKINRDDKFTKEILPFMEQKGEIRKTQVQIKQEQVDEEQPQVKKIQIKKIKFKEEDEILNGKQKQERMKNYGRYYLKAEEFQRLINDQKERQKKKEQEELQAQSYRYNQMQK